MLAACTSKKIYRDIVRQEKFKFTIKTIWQIESSWTYLKVINKIRYIKDWIFTGKSLNRELREPAIKEMEYEKI